MPIFQFEQPVMDEDNEAPVFFMRQRPIQEPHMLVIRAPINEQQE